MSTFIKVMLGLCLLAGSFGGGYYVSNIGYKVVDSSGNSVVKSNAAQTVKDENARLSREVIGKSESEAEKLLNDNNRTFFVGIRDGQKIENAAQKTFTNLTVEVKNNKVVKILGWY